MLCSFHRYILFDIDMTHWLFAFCAQPLWHAVLGSQSIAVAVRNATQVFRNRSVSEPEASAEFLAMCAFQDVTSRSRARMERRRVGNGELRHFVSLCERRERDRMPVQFLAGEWDFHHISLKLRPPVLIPRPETEELVQLVLDHDEDNNKPSKLNDMKSTAEITSNQRHIDDPHTIERRKSKRAFTTDQGDKQHLHILDVGCGSGAIALALLAARPEWTCVATDIVEHAVHLTRENARRLALQQRVKVECGTAQDALKRHGRTFDMIVTNPPYIPDKDMAVLPREMAQHEDDTALRGGADGLRVVREILSVAGSLIRSGGTVWLEVDSTHPALLKNEKFTGLCFAQARRDLYGNDRFVQFDVL